MAVFVVVISGGLLAVFNHISESSVSSNKFKFHLDRTTDWSSGDLSMHFGLLIGYATYFESTCSSELVYYILKFCVVYVTN